jgi:hypothetical protein
VTFPVDDVTFPIEDVTTTTVQDFFALRNRSVLIRRFGGFSRGPYKEQGRPPRVFAALAGATSGTVKIVAPSAGHRSSYDWQSSPDGKTWTDLGTTLQAKTTLTGQTPGTVLQLRYRPVLKAGAGDWSAPVTLTVK